MLACRGLSHSSLKSHLVRGSSGLFEVLFLGSKDDLGRHEAARPGSSLPLSVKGHVPNDDGESLLGEKDKETEGNNLPP